MTEVEWMNLYIKLTNFLRDNKRYPKADAKDESERNLAAFVREQRDAYKANALEKYKETLLKSINFYWDYDKVKRDESDTTWQNYEERYVQELVNSNGERVQRTGKTAKLSSWEAKQRKEEKNGSLDADRQYELEKVGFPFDDSKLPKTQQRNIWFKNYNKLIELLKIVGGDYELVQSLPEFKSIEKWFNRQLDEEQKGSLEDDRKYLLDNISFPFTSKYKNNGPD